GSTPRVWDSRCARRRWPCAASCPERNERPMITRFSTLYVGHLELEACGLSGTPADDRRYSNARLVESFDTAATVARAADALGYETFWLAEHHFQHEGWECIANIPLLAVDLAPRTRRIQLEIGTRQL